MKKGKAFIIVGHENWGKSRTLYSLTKSHHKGWFEIHGIWFFIRRMSNDDKPKELLTYVKNTVPTTKPFIIITLCPSFKVAWKNTTKILQILESKYELFFLVIKKKYINSEEISEDEINNLKKYGIIEIIENKIEDIKRAKRLQRFIYNNK